MEIGSKKLEVRSERLKNVVAPFMVQNPTTVVAPFMMRAPGVETLGACPWSRDFSLLIT